MRVLDLAYNTRLIYDTVRRYVRAPMIRQFWSIMTESVRSNANTVRYVDPCSRGFDLRVYFLFLPASRTVLLQPLS